MADPRFIRDQQGTVYDLSGGYLDRVADPTDFKARSGTDDIQGQSLLVDNPQQYLTGVFTNQAKARYQPQLDLALQGIDQAGQEIGIQERDIGRQYDTLGQNLEEAARASSATLAEQANQYGLLSSGLTAAGLGKIGTDLAKNKELSAQDKASQLAQLALKRAGLSTQAAGVKVQASQSIDDLVGQLLSNSTQAQQAAFQRELQLQQIAASIPKGQSVTVAGKTIQGTAAPKLNQIDLGNRVVNVDEAGNIVSSYAKGVTPGSGSASLSSAAGKNAALLNAVQQAFASGQYTSTGESGKKSREQLIGELSAVFAGTGITDKDIKDAVYGTNRNVSEGAYDPNKSSAAAKPATAEQTASAGFAARVDQSNTIFDQLAPKITSINPISYSLQLRLPSYLQTPEIQQQLQAQRNFINAVLRKESGAAISQSEFDSAAKQYFPQPGDSPQVLEQKRQNRLQVQANLVNASGSAYRPPLSSFLTP